jgi:hypothetical protein
MDEGEFEKLTDQFKGDYEQLRHAYNVLETKYDRLKTNVIGGIAAIIFIGGFILYQNSLWAGGIISGILVIGIIGTVGYLIIKYIVSSIRKYR